MTHRTHIEFHHFRCQSASRHEFSGLVRSVDGKLSYKPGQSPDWSPIALCPEPSCSAIGVTIADIRQSGFPAQIPEGQRFFGWLSPDGQTLSVPTPTGDGPVKMPGRYAAAGYRLVEAQSLSDLDALMAIRERQTGNVCSHETDHSAERRAERQDAEPSDDPTVDT
jgi:hypothetical protein